MVDTPIKSPFESPQSPEVPVDAESALEADERAYEQTVESKEHFLEEDQSSLEEIRQAEQATPTASATGAHVQPVVRDEVTLRVEKILEEGMGDLYASLPDDAKPMFKKKGEEAASQIAVMIRTLKHEVAKVVRLIRDWLLTIPKANKFYLEQEAKIKTDALMEYVEARQDELSKHP